MVTWTAEERKAITSVWSKVNPEEVGHEALIRLFIVYPWTQRYFSTFGSLSSSTVIARNFKVQQHAAKVINALTEAIRNIDNLKASFSDLSKLHFQKLHVDPENFKLLGKTLIITLSEKLGSEFSPQIQAAWEKFMALVIDSLSRQYN
ncbi:hemoglobin subunit beta-2-like [Latimeria chalumnae]|uniref:hemoglobin subunit beta-2-like n=1 Tax=Latimeria chalumnae TaxID=7897 RepID=UPI0003C16005|nr:PREDICTED: hemoglobin subunit beta-2-like [Latimeria chalumnae]|eukprot:XP_006011110.1 PREDICTED: hemoglobin subunit beta-2-like [Latimeria chalumnae]